jgi:hypothetical protein
VGLTAYEELLEEAYELLGEMDGKDPRRSDIRAAANALKSYLTSGKPVYIGNADLLCQELTAAMNAPLPEEPPVEESLPEESTPPESQPAESQPSAASTSKNFPWWAVVAGAAVLSAAVAVIAILRKKKS